MIPRNPPVTMVVVGLCIAVYLLVELFGQRAIISPLLISAYIQPVLPELRAGEIWRLVTPAVIHFGLFHLVFNMLWTWELGRLIEWRQGAIMLATLILLLAAISNLAQYFVSGPLFGGMSGVVYGLFGYVWLQGVTNPRFGTRLNPAVVKILLIWFIICWSGVLKLLDIHIANTAHSAGLAAGMVLSLGVTAVARGFQRTED